MEWLGSCAAAAAARMELPAPALGRLSLSRATLHAHMAGEPIPRVARGIDASLRLGEGYDSMRLALTGALRTLRTLRASRAQALAGLSSPCRPWRPHPSCLPPWTLYRLHP